MQIKILNGSFISPHLLNPKVGEIRTVDADFGNHLISSGLATGLKIAEPVKKKAVEPSSASQAAPVSRKKTATKRKAKVKPSQSTIVGD